MGEAEAKRELNKILKQLDKPEIAYGYVDVDGEWITNKLEKLKQIWEK